MNKYLFIIVLAFCFISCSENSVVEEDELFEYTQRTSNSFYISSLTQAIIVENSIGSVNISGGSDTNQVDYVLDKTVKVKSSSLSQAAFDKIYLDPNPEGDSIHCKIISPTDNFTSKCNMNLIIPYYKPIIVKNTTGNILLSNLFSEAYIEADSYDCTISRHNSSIEARSNSGNIFGSISLPKNGEIKCNSGSGDIHLQIPINSSVNIQLKTEGGTIKYNNLSINIISNLAKELKGTLNAGEGNIYIESKSGNIVLEGI